MICAVIPLMDRTLHPITAIRRMRLCLLLPLLLVLAQHGAWLHELSHATYAASPHQAIVQQAEASFENGVCPSCQSFGQLGSALASSIAAVFSPVSHSCPQAQPQYAQPAPDLPAPRNRGPPLLA
jgi:hypothetical protein